MDGVGRTGPRAEPTHLFIRLHAGKDFKLGHGEVGWDGMGWAMDGGVSGLVCGCDAERAR